MPYNTRRKSVSLELLGIHVPQSSRSSSHRSPPAMAAADLPPPKRRKQSHSSNTIPASSRSSISSASRSRDDHQTPMAGRAAVNTPPPSPGRELGPSKIDTEGINDDIVVGVIEQLEKTGNRPHSLKELAAVLLNTLPSVESSANPSAIISSRLLTYSRRPWTALSPCPVANELVEGHPKKLYYFLTGIPRQPFPTNAPDAAVIAANRIISPSLSSAADSEERDARKREQMSPSPEVDLSSPEFDDDAASSFSSANHAMHSSSHGANMSHSRRAQSPQLERDEREFTQTATSLQMRRQTEAAAAAMQKMVVGKAAVASSTTAVPTATSLAPLNTGMGVPPVPQLMVVEESPETAARKNMEMAAELFLAAVPAAQAAHATPELRPHHLELQIPFSAKRLLSSPVIPTIEKMGVEESWNWSELRSPEHIELDELENMFDF